MRDQCIYADCSARKGDDHGEIPAGNPDGCAYCRSRQFGRVAVGESCICVPFNTHDPAPVDPPTSARGHRSGLHLVTPADDYADAPSPFPGSPRQPGIIRMLEDWLRYTKDGHVDACFIVSTTPTGDFMYAVAGQSLREDAWTLVGGIEVAKQHHISLLLEGKLRVKPPADGGGDGKEG